MTPDELAALMELEAKATPGPWHSEAEFGGWWVVTGGPNDYAVHPATDPMPGVVLGGSYSGDADAAFIAALRNAAPSLIADAREAGSGELKEALESMVHQFAYWSDGSGGLGTGGLSALEEAFAVLGWPDPYPVPESCCQWPDGCKKRGSMGTPVAEEHPTYGGKRYVWTCWDHSPASMLRVALSPEPGSSVESSETTP